MPPTAKPSAPKTTGTAFARTLTALSDRARPLARRIRPLAGKVRPLARRIRPLAGKVRPLAGRIRRQGPARLAVAAAILITLGLLVWWAVAAFAGSPQSPADGGSPAPAASSEPAPASRGTLPLEGVSPLDFQLRDCFKDFDPDAQKSTVVDCATGHSAQLIAVEKYAADDSYPGREELKQKARNACKAAALADKEGDYKLSYKLAYPSSSSWGKGDRRVDCYVVTDAGNVITKSLLP